MKKYLRTLSRMAIIDFVFFFITLFFLNKQISPSKAITKNVIDPILNLEVQTPNLGVSTTDKTTTDPTPTSPPDLSSQLSQHNSRSSCWFIIDGQLYDITSFFGSHPGGDGTLLKYCGTDASNGFHTKDAMIPADHSASAKAMLQQYLIQ
ncbi:MAG: cytochrome b5-like heme/steroid binding domain-containing protein [Patescibacteria group bacterium]|jgi:cytochrome b involved in lipid metabolism